MLDFVQDYLKQGFSLVPLGFKTKIPIKGIEVKEFFSREPTEKEIKDWFKGKKRNIGIVTGRISRLLVIDIDNEKGLQVLTQKLKEKNITLPETTTVKTGKGLHLYFRLPEGEEIKTRIQFLSSIDIKAEGGYVVAPPSIHPNGEKYEFIKSLSYLKEIPKDLLDFIKELGFRSESQKSPDIDSREVKLPEAENHQVEELLNILNELGLMDGAFLPTHQQYIKIKCPFHGDTIPSFSIILEPGYKARPFGYARCFGCGKKFRNYVHLLNALANHPRFKGKIKYKPERIKEKVFPIYDTNGNLAYYQEIWFNPETGKKEVFYSHKTEEDGKRGTGIPDKKYPYGLNTVIEAKENKIVMIFESPQDAEAVRFAVKDQPVLATCGANNWHDWWGDILKGLKKRGFTKAYIIPQADTPGREWAIKMFSRCKEAGLKTVISLVCEKERVKDIAELIESLDKEDAKGFEDILIRKINQYTQNKIPYLYHKAPDMLNKIKIKRLGSYAFIVEYNNSELKAEVTLLRNKSGITADIWIKDNTIYNGKILPYKVDLDRPASFKKFEKELEKEITTVPGLADLIRQEALKGLENEKKNFKKLRKGEAKNKPLWFIEPLVYKNAYTLLYAPKASGKTTLSCFLAMLVQNDCKNLYPFEVEKGNVLYLDWENPRDFIARKMDWIAECLGLENPDYPFFYEASQPLTSIAYDVTRVISEETIKFVIIDSLIPSLGRESSFDHSGATTYHAIIKEWGKMGCSVLILTHMAKKDIKESGDSLWYGSVMFGNLAKVVWQASAINTSDEVNTTLKCIYNNYGKLANPFDIVFNFKDNRIKVNKDTIDESALPLTERVKRILKSGGKTLQAIAEEIFNSEEERERGINKVKNTLQYLKRKGIVTLVNHIYYLKGSEGECPEEWFEDPIDEL